MYSRLDQGTNLQELWQVFSRSVNQQEYSQAWLGLQCARIPQAISGVLVLRDDQHPASFAVAAQWPPDQPPAPETLDQIDRVVEEQCGLVIELDDGGSPAERFGVAYPLKIGPEIAGIVALTLVAEEEALLTQAMEQLQWGISWIELMVRRHQGAQLVSELPRVRSAIEILTGVLAQNRFANGCATFVTEIAATMGCDRVSLGEVRAGDVHIVAISNNAEFGKQMNLVKLLEAAMDEALSQRTEVVIPAERDSTLILRDHDLLAHKHGCGAIYTLPLFREGRYWGVLTLERVGDQPFSETELATVRAVAGLGCEALYLLQQNGRSLSRRLIDKTRAELDRFIVPGYAGRKLAAMVVAVMLLFFGFASGDYRVSADAELEGSVRQVVVAPFDGYIEKAVARAGDQVGKDQPLAVLDDRELSLERINWLAEGAKFQRQYEEAVANLERGKARVLAAQWKQSQAKLDLAELQLERTELKAPFDGVVVNGDLSQRIGGAVKQGEILFEVAPLDSYRLIIWVDEFQIADISANLKGQLVLKALPDQTFSLSVTRITPQTEARDGGNFFRVEAAVEGDARSLRPGMEGVAKIEVGQRNLFATLTSDLYRWLTLKLWAWTP